MIITNSPGVQIISASGKNRHTVTPLIISVLTIETEYCIECFIWFLMLESPEEENEFTDKGLFMIWVKYDPHNKAFHLH